MQTPGGSEPARNVAPKQVRLSPRVLIGTAWRATAPRGRLGPGIAILDGFGWRRNVRLGRVDDTHLRIVAPDHSHADEQTSTHQYRCQTTNRGLQDHDLQVRSSRVDPFALCRPETGLLSLRQASNRHPVRALPYRWIPRSTKLVAEGTAAPNHDVRRPRITLLVSGPTARAKRFEHQETPVKVSPRPEFVKRSIEIFSNECIRRIQIPVLINSLRIDDGLRTKRIRNAC